ncbi:MULTISPECIES: hypothetical protein [Brevundimonas]|uniref:hypothetical protein n=1 Tax=Brevundimonas TaxID=41275 RepID=UPI00190486C1|nr:MULTISPECIES: hypothetical protein [Brevundimonas]MBK1975490.1 hypothetical protein [Brevundimonas diminuta]
MDDADIVEVGAELSDRDGAMGQPVHSNGEIGRPAIRTAFERADSPRRLKAKTDG